MVSTKNKMMGQQSKPHIETKYLLETSNQFYQDLLSYSQSEKLIQLKGGTEKNAIRKYDGDVSTESFWS